MIATRRQAVNNLLALGGALAACGPTIAAADDAFDLRGDDGKPVTNFRLASEFSVTGLPGIVWAGSAAPDATLIEFFDYNCPWCRKAATDLDAMASRDAAFRIGLVNYAIISIGSIQAAKVQQAFLRLYGPEKAYAFHKAMFARRGVNDGATALQTVASLGGDKAAVEAAADGDDVNAVLKRQARLAESAGFNATPSFVMNGVGILGYPGARNVTAMIAAVRKCERLVCA